MIEAAIGLQAFVQRVLAGVAERRMAEIMDQRHAFRQILVELHGAGERARDLGDLDRVGQTGAIMVAVVCDEDLRLVFQAAEGRRMDDAVAVALEVAARRACRFGIEPSTRCPRVCRIDGALTIAESKPVPVESHFRSATVQSSAYIAFRARP